MKIGFFADGYLPQKNGVATSVAEYADALEAQGHEVTIIAPKYPKYKDKKKNVIRLSSINYKKEIGIRVALYLPEKSFRQLLKLDFDLIHGHGDGPITLLGWTIAKRKNIPFVLSHHTFWNKYTHYLPGGRIISPKIVEKFVRIFTNSCSYIISPSYLAKRELQSYGITKPIKVIHHGLDLSNYKDGDKKFLRKKLKLTQDQKILLFVGRLGKEKSVDLLIQAFALIHRQMPNTHFVLVGDGVQKGYLKQLAADLGIAKNTHFLGEVDYAKIPSIFHSADVFVFASKTETLGKVILEALAAGLPTITLNIPPFKELISQGKDGLLVSYNAKRFADKTIELLQNNDLYTDISKNARIKAQQFSIESTIGEIEKIYAKLLHQHKIKERKGIQEIITKFKNLIDVEFR